MRATRVAALAAVPAFAAGVGVTALFDDDSATPRVERDEVQRSVWEAHPGAGAPPECSAERSTGIGTWRCTVFFRSDKRPPKVVAIQVSHSGKVTRADGRELACCVRVKRAP